MDKLYYCLDCKRIFTETNGCSYCASQNTKALVKSAPVNVIGTKTKGNVLKIQGDMVQLLLVDEKNNRYIKEFQADKIRKVL
ncbi:DNA-directed RNA polymerase subunit RPC12/RpoP [Anaerosolibacter carboniphilus]|uniref:DNA-directed RNA polymerase subunit RPC12/RpoP n=1 Tax=Anaerosolibacter carboniphilus TaxID=1417629 RepID=A0A841KXR4_9FIRM|nr:hypothetical protein [Anaerosolibacter carboniphilus]MBB6218536.1 DNA-directed RNA polymerase subunit RPC12/RpoP [Anaerosolibacter carboniphilus]